MEFFDHEPISGDALTFVGDERLDQLIRHWERVTVIVSDHRDMLIEERVRRETPDRRTED